MIRPSMRRRIAAAILGADRRGDRPSAVAHQRRLPVGRRLLTSVLGVQARPSVPTVSPRTDPKGNAEATRTHGTSYFASPPDTPSPPPRSRHQKARSRYTGDRVPRRTSSGGRQEYDSRRVGPEPQHLLSEDRREYERILDEALRSAPHLPGLAPLGRRFSTEQLRTMALNATAIITAAAATEYQHYVSVREGASRLPPSASSSGQPGGSEDPGTGATGLAATVGEVQEPGGAGVGAVVAVLAPVLAGAVAVFSLLVGFLLKVFVPTSVFGHVFLTVGWISCVVTGAAVVVAGVALLVTALRHGPLPETERGNGVRDEVALAGEAWREALLERGIVPFLQDVLSDPGTPAATRGTAPSEPTSRVPLLGYDRPSFTSPEEGPSHRTRPRFTSPDYAGPADGRPATGPENPDGGSSS